jgi:hypothetical protein
MPDAVAYRLDWQDWTAWVESGGSMPGRKHPEAHHETFTSREEAEARRAALRQRGRPDLIASITPLYAISAPVVRRKKPRHGGKRRTS